MEHERVTRAIANPANGLDSNFTYIRIQIHQICGRGGHVHSETRTLRNRLMTHQESSRQSQSKENSVFRRDARSSCFWIPSLGQGLRFPSFVDSAVARFRHGYLF